MKYKVLNETGVVVEGSDAAHAVGEIIELDETSQVTQKWVETGVVELATEDTSSNTSTDTTGTDTTSEDQTTDQQTTEVQQAPGPRVITQDDLDANPVLTELGAAVGDTVSVTKTA